MILYAKNHTALEAARFNNCIREEDDTFYYCVWDIQSSSYYFINLYKIYIYATCPKARFKKILTQVQETMNESNMMKHV